MKQHDVLFYCSQLGFTYLHLRLEIGIFAHEIAIAVALLIALGILSFNFF